MASYNLGIIIWKELLHRRGRFWSGLLTISLGIAMILGIHAVTNVSQQLVAEKLDELGANILILPQGATASDYYSADVDAPTIPEEYVERIATSMLPGVDNLSPKLSRSIEIRDSKFILTGILPINELASKPVWQISDLATIELQTACGTQGAGGGETEQEASKRAVIEDLESDEVWLGSSAAEVLSLAVGDSILVEKQIFNIVHVLPETGTIDDSRIFAHLHVVQQMLGTGPQVSVIEIMGCCNAISDGLLSKLRNILPDTRVTSISHIVQTQIETNHLMSKVTLILLIIISIVGMISISNNMWANVQERQKELGTYITLGFMRGHIYYLFLIKALALGVLGGLIGFLIGSLSSLAGGYTLIDLPVLPRITDLFWAILIAIIISLGGTVYPVRRAVKIDPALIMREQ